MTPEQRAEVHAQILLQAEADHYAAVIQEIAARAKVEALRAAATVAQ